jgi:hypothetical protein
VGGGVCFPLLASWLVALVGWLVGCSRWLGAWCSWCAGSPVFALGGVLVSAGVLVVGALLGRCVAASVRGVWCVFPPPPSLFPPSPPVLPVSTLAAFPCPSSPSSVSLRCVCALGCVVCLWVCSCCLLWHRSPCAGVIGRFSALPAGGVWSWGFLLLVDLSCCVCLLVPRPGSSPAGRPHLKCNLSIYLTCIYYQGLAGL